MHKRNPEWCLLHIVRYHEHYTLDAICDAPGLKASHTKNPTPHGPTLANVLNTRRVCEDVLSLAG